MHSFNLVQFSLDGACAIHAEFAVAKTADFQQFHSHLFMIFSNNACCHFLAHVYFNLKSVQFDLKSTSA